MEIKGIAHLHSTYSYDGQLSLSQTKELLIKEGLQFACMTEHTDDLTIEAMREFIKDCAENSDEKFVFIPGFEVPYKDMHLLMIGVQEILPEETDNLTLQIWREQTSLVVLAHPSRNNFIIDDVIKNILDGVEVWNSYYDGKSALRARSLRLLQELQKENSKMYAFTGLDMHREEHIGGPVLLIDIKALSVENILPALICGEYTFEKQDIIISSYGKIEKGGIKKTQYKSAIRLFVLSIANYINRILAFLGLPVPKSIKKKLRSKL